MIKTVKTVFEFRWLRHSSFLVTALFFAFFNSARAEVISVSIAELDNAIYDMESRPDALATLALRRIQQSLDDANLTLGNGEILYRDIQTDLDVDSGCTRTEIRSLDTTIVLESGSGLTLSLENLYQPIQLTIELDTRISVVGRAKQIIGFRLGSCQDLANDNFDFSASGNARLLLQLTLSMNPTIDTDAQTLTFRPSVSLDGQLEKQNINVEVDDSLLRSILEDFLEDEIDDAFADSRVVQSIDELESALVDSLEENLTEGAVVLELPKPTDEQITALYRLLTPEGDFSLSLGYMRTHRVELLAALLLGDTAGISRVTSNAIQCQAASVLQTSMLHTPVFELNNAGCQVIQIPNQQVTGAFNTIYSDAQCLNAIDYFATDTVDYCTQVLDAERLGNAASFPEQLNQWTLSPGTRFDIGALSLAGKLQPFTQRINYRTVTTDMGECQLEMRIHSSLPTSPGTSVNTTQRALIAFHGGSWQRRSSGALGIEALAAQFVNEGFVVFAPFYRLIGTAEGNEACNNATLEQVLDDAHAALSWVQENGSEYGVSDKPVLFGQSAGGHLAAVLGVERPEEVASAVLFYAPSDFAEFARLIIEGEIETETGQDILETVVGQTLDTLDVQSPLIQRNSLSPRVVNREGVAPPFFILHGVKDTVLPVSQSVRLCNALAGNPDNGPASNLIGTSDELRSVVSCGRDGSELHLITEGEHALDLCIAEELCLSGSPESAALTADTMNKMLEWIQVANPDTQQLGDDSSTGRSGSGGGSIGSIALLLMLLKYAFTRTGIRRVAIAA